MDCTNDKKLIPAGVFGNGMVLQRGKESRIFGKSAGKEVTAFVEKDGCKECYKAPVTGGAFVVALGIHESTGYLLPFLLMQSLLQKNCHSYHAKLQ